MKYSFKMLFTFLIMIICHKSFSQNLITETREMQEIKLIFKDAINKKLEFPYYLGIRDTLILPTYFTSYQEYYARRKSIPKINWSYFVQSNSNNIYLSKSDCKILNRTILNDTNRLYIQKSWFVNDKIIISSDTNTHLFSKDIFMKPIFFRNYSRCFIAILYVDGVESFFLKKINKNWVFDKFYFRLDED